MRHQKKRHKLGRTHAHRKATMAALSSALIQHKRITTTLPKAKALRTFVEPLITRAKDDTSHNRRQVFRRLNDKQTVSELFGDVAAQVGDRPGGYTRVVKLGRRHGDGAEMAMIELVDYNDVQPEGGSSGRRRTRRGGGKGRRRRGGAKKAAQAAATTSTETVDAVDAGADVEKATDVVEQPVDEAQATPVPERTEPDAEAKEHAEEAQEIVEKQKADAAAEPEQADTGEEAGDDDADGDEERSDA